MAPQHGFMAQIPVAREIEPGLLCPEYLLVADTVVYVLSLLPVISSYRQAGLNWGKFRGF